MLVPPRGNYTALDFPQARHGAATFTFGINNSDEIVGYYVNTQQDSHGLFYSGGAYSTLNDPAAYAGGISTTGISINNADQIVGDYSDASGVRHGFLYSGGVYTTIDDPLSGGQAGAGTHATGINDAGEIVGWYMDSSGVVHGFLDINSTFTTIDDPLATAGTHITGINNSGEIVGYYTDGTGNHGFIATTVNAAPVLSFIGPVINAAADTAWPVTVAGTAGETGTLVFTDSFGHNVSVNVNGDGRYSVNLSMLTDGSINSTLTLTDGSSVSGSPLTLVGAPLPSDKYVRLLASSTGNLGKVGTDAASVIDASQTSNITFKTGNGPDTIIAGPNDVVYAGTGHDTVIGANGATLYAGSGPETLYGAPGETIFGGSGADTFAFEPGSGVNTVSNFHKSNDVLQFNPSMFASYAAMLNDGAIKQVGSNTVITDHLGDSVTLVGVTASSLTANNFHFA